MLWQQRAPLTETNPAVATQETVVENTMIMRQADKGKQIDPINRWRLPSLCNLFQKYTTGIFQKRKMDGKSLAVVKRLRRNIPSEMRAVEMNFLNCGVGGGLG